jgi:serine/threonine-protein kinase
MVALALGIVVVVAALGTRIVFPDLLVSSRSAQPAVASQHDAQPTQVDAASMMSEGEYRTLLDGWQEGNLLREARRHPGQIETTVAASPGLDAGRAPAVMMPAPNAPAQESTRPSASAVVLPNLLGLTYVQAVSQLHALGLTTERSEETNLSVPAEVILQQSPAAGEAVEAPAVIALVVSLGNQLRMPDVYGLPQQDAVQLLTSKGLQVPSWAINQQGRNTDIPEATLRQVCAGCVLSARPQAGSLVPVGSEVYLAVRSE